jgi:uncharacterized protein (TIGR02145 family)
LCNGTATGTIRIEKINSKVAEVEKKSKITSKGLQGTIDMIYHDGERLKFTGMSGNYSTIKTDIPAESKNIEFNFIPCVDGEFNYYPVTVIGTQVWMTENLRTTKYNDSNVIPLVTDNTAWGNLSTPGYCWYDNNEAAYKPVYGALYNWYTVNTGRLCPSGWQVPTSTDWSALFTYLGGINTAAKKLKETGSTHWFSDPYGDNTGTNETGFSARAGGSRDNRNTGSLSCEFAGINYWGNWWASNQVSSSSGTAVNTSSIDENFNILPPSKFWGYSVRCLYKPLANISVTTTNASAITETSATSGGNVVITGGENVTSRGICWSTTANPSISDNKTTDGNGSGIYTSSITGLSKFTVYHLRAYATCSFGTVYGSEITFATKGGPVGVSDIDGNVYSSVQIGTQVWMSENLRTTKFNDGTSIPTVNDNIAWLRLTTPAFSWYSFNESAYKETYGGLYNWYAVGTGNLCPDGWHVPTDTDWTTLSTYLGGESVAGGKLKETGTTHWRSPNTGATNETWFSALPAGERVDFGIFSSMNNTSSWWSLTPVDKGVSLKRFITYDSGSLGKANAKDVFGYSVRCVYGSIRMVITAAASLITQTSATCGGTVMKDDAGTVITRGVCWSTSPNPTIADNATSDGSVSGTFTSSLSGLTANTKYYYKAYATYSSGTEYGSENFFSTKGESGTVSDIDGNSYSTIQIGTQIWMAENLKTTLYKDGTAIPLVSPDNEWKLLTTPGYCWYQNNEATNKVLYGALYNWYTVSTGNLCPTGWHVPSVEDWNTLLSYYGGSAAGDKLKEAGDTYWGSDPWGYNKSTNESGFSARAGGCRTTAMPIDPNSIAFEDAHYWGHWWTSTSSSSTLAYNVLTGYRWGDISITSSGVNTNKKSGQSVRCIKD